MADGRETRAEIDNETVRGLLLVNGGGAVALLAFLPGVLQKPELEHLARSIILAVFTFQIGLACAVIHNRLRRICSLAYAKKDRKPCVLLGRQLKEPCVCHWSTGFMWGSIGAFVLAGAIMLNAGLNTVSEMAGASAHEQPVLKVEVVSPVQVNVAEPVKVELPEPPNHSLRVPRP